MIPSNYGIREDSWELLGLQRIPNQSILAEISPEYSLEGLMLKLQYLDHLMRWTDSVQKPLMLGKIEGRRRMELQSVRWLDGITNWMGMSLSKLGSWWWTGKPSILQSIGSQRVGHTKWLNWKWFKNTAPCVLI